MKLSVIIPALNERNTIQTIIEMVQEVKLDKEIIVVDDGSDDGTGEILDGMASDVIKVIHHPQRRGKGAAIRTGLQEATGEIIIIQDADTEYDPQDYYRLVEPIVQGKAEVVYGSRFRGSIKNMRFLNYLMNRILAWLANLLYRAHITDEATCYKVFRADLLKSIPLRCEGFEFCPEVTAKVRKRGKQIYEVPISYVARTWEEGKKINWKDGWTAIYTLLKYRFTD